MTTGSIRVASFLKKFLKKGLRAKKEFIIGSVYQTYTTYTKEKFKVSKGKIFQLLTNCQKNIIYDASAKIKYLAKSKKCY